MWAKERKNSANAKCVIFISVKRYEQGSQSRSVASLPDPSNATPQLKETTALPPFQYYFLSLFFFINQYYFLFLFLIFNIRNGGEDVYY